MSPRRRRRLPVGPARDRAGGAARALLERALGVPVSEDGDPAALTARVPADAPATPALTALEGAGIDLARFALGRPGLDEVFLALTGRPAEDAGTPMPPEASR